MSRGSVSSAYAEHPKVAYDRMRAEQRAKAEAALVQRLKADEAMAIDAWERRAPAPVVGKGLRDRAAARAYYLDQIAAAKRQARAYSLPSLKVWSAYFEEQVRLAEALLIEWERSTELANPVAAIATARSFRVAVDALPVGKDIRNRLLAHIDAHIAALEGDAG